MRDDIKDIEIYRAPGDDVLNLGNNENFFSQWNERLSAEIAEIVQTTDFSSYGPELHRDLLRAYASFLSVDENQVMVGAGTEVLIPLLFNALTDKKLLLLEPDFFRYEEQARIAKREIVSVKLGDSCYDEIIEHLDAADVELVILSSPNNPLGLVHPREKLVEILEHAKCPVVIDEAYAEYSGETIIDLLNEYPQLIVLRTLSKAFGLAGLRVGFIISQAERIQYLLAIQGPFTVSALNAGIARLVLQHSAEVEKQVQQTIFIREEFCNFLRKHPELEFIESAANFVYVKHPEALTIKKRLLERKINVSYFLKPVPALRITIGTEEQMLRLQLELEKILKT